jgi:GntR family phosphonate transport system transcriptional regulator
VHARRGAGVFVQHRQMPYPIGKRVRFHQNLLAAGRVPEKRVLMLQTRAASPQEAEALQLAEGARVHVYEGLSLSDDVPIALFRSVFPAERLPDMLNALRDTGSVTAASPHTASTTIPAHGPKSRPNRPMPRSRHSCG